MLWYEYGDGDTGYLNVGDTLRAESDFPPVSGSGCGGSTGGHGRLAFNKTGCNILLKEGG